MCHQPWPWPHSTHFLLPCMRVYVCRMYVGASQCVCALLCSWYVNCTSRTYVCIWLCALSSTRAYTRHTQAHIRTAPRQRSDERPEISGVYAYMRHGVAEQRQSLTVNQSLGNYQKKRKTATATHGNTETEPIIKQTSRPVVLSACSGASTHRPHHKHK